MRSNVLCFPSRGLSAGQQRHRGRQRPAPAGNVVEIVGLDRAFGEKEYLLQRLPTRATPSSLPIVPYLPNGIDACSRRIERETLALSPRPQRVFRPKSSHGSWCKRIPNILTSACSGFKGSFVSANVLPFHPMKDDPNRIRELRTALGMSQQTLGDLVGVSKVTISDLERGNMELTLSYMKRIAPHLNAHPADLLPREANPWALTREERDFVARLRQGDTTQRQTLAKVADAVIPFGHDDRDVA